MPLASTKRVGAVTWVSFAISIFLIAVSRERHSVLDEGLRPITLAIGLEEGVGERRAHRERADLADAAGDLADTDDLHLDVRRLVHPHQTVVVEVLLVGGAVGEGDFLEHRVAQSEYDPAFDTVFTQHRIDCQARVARGEGPRYANPGRTLGDFDDRGDARGVEVRLNKRDT